MHACVPGLDDITVGGSTCESWLERGGAYFGVIFLFSLFLTLSFRAHAELTLR